MSAVTLFEQYQRKLADVLADAWSYRASGGIDTDTKKRGYKAQDELKELGTKVNKRIKVLEGNRAKLIKNLESGIIKNENRLSICEKNSSDAAFCQGIISNCKFIISLLEEV